MTVRRLAALSVLAAGAALPWLQDPAPAPKAPPEARAPADEPRHPYEGVYLLRRRVVLGMEEPRPSRGYVAITRRHMLLCLIAPGDDPDLPLLRAGVRTWKPDRERIATTVELGFFTDANGRVHVDPRGEQAVRRVELARGLLRLYQDDRSYLEFERLE